MRPAAGNLTRVPVAPWSSYRKSVQKDAPAARRPVPQVRGKCSPNGQPAGEGNRGSGRRAAAGAPSGMPSSTTNGASDGISGWAWFGVPPASRRAVRTGSSARSNNDPGSFITSRATDMVFAVLPKQRVTHASWQRDRRCPGGACCRRRRRRSFCLAAPPSRDRCAPTRMTRSVRLSAYWLSMVVANGS